MASILDAAQSPCAPTTSAEVQILADEAVAAWERMDRTGFRTTAERMIASVPCVSDELRRPLAADLHRVVGLALFLEDDLSRAQQAFGAARRIEPGWVMPEAIAPAGHPVALAYTGLTLHTGSIVEAPVPREGAVQFDGQAVLERPLDLPTLFQKTGPDGRVVATAYLSPGDAIPVYDAAITLEGATAPRADTTTGSARTSIPLAVAGGAAALIAGGLYAIAGMTAQDYRDNTNTDAGYEGLRSTTNGLVLTSAGVGVVALGFGVSAVVVGRW